MTFIVTEIEEIPANKLTIEGLHELDHISQFIMNNSGVRNKEENLIEQFALITRSAETTVTTFKINEVKVWAKNAEWKQWQKVLVKNPSYIEFLYVNGTTTPLVGITSGARATGVDGYELRIKYQL